MSFHRQTQRKTLRALFARREGSASTVLTR
jgi:hypothetical protein